MFFILQDELDASKEDAARGVERARMFQEEVHALQEKCTQVRQRDSNKR